LWSFVPTKADNLLVAEEHMKTYGDAWVWWAFAPVGRLVLGFVIGQHDQAYADRWLQPVAWVTDETVPFFTSDQWPAYTQALLNVYGEGYGPPRCGTRGRYPKPRQRPRADRWYAQVIMHRTKGRITAMDTPIVLGDPAEITARWTQSPVSRTSNTSFVERDHLTQRQQLPFCVTSSELAPPVTHGRIHPGFWISPAMVPHHSGNGCWPDRSRLDHGRMALVPGLTAVLG
jgi:IS1 family transposase